MARMKRRPVFQVSCGCPDDVFADSVTLSPCHLHDKIRKMTESFEEIMALGCPLEAPKLYFAIEKIRKIITKTLKENGGK